MCIDDVVRIAMIKTFPNQKPWIGGSTRVKLKAQTTAFNQGKVTGNMTEYKQCRYSLHKAIKQAKRQYRDKVESQLNGSYARGTVWRTSTWYTADFAGFPTYKACRGL